ncbi:hypothetical protein VNO80_21815 [Phaseolus coccineus]|uniref:Proteasome endopeptidase complex n=1 Tax=Phaseolus coccineus TaxID=3886 RepID=A0AAN9M8J5_PHACN
MSSLRWWREDEEDWEKEMNVCALEKRSFSECLRLVEEKKLQLERVCVCYGNQCLEIAKTLNPKKARSEAECGGVRRGCGCLKLVAGVFVWQKDMVSSQLQLHRYHTGRESRVVTALTLLKKHLFNYQSHVSAALVLGGVDITGPHLHTIYPHGSTDTLPFATMESGSLAAMSVFESKYKESLNRDGGIKLVVEAICAGIFNDLGSGSNVDVCVITKGHKEYLRNHLLPNPRTYVNPKGFEFPKKIDY